MYTVYKITNLINNKFYIGVHKTENPNDSYMGSGIAIKEAIQKYGRENFKKEILFITEDKIEAYNIEEKLTLDFSDRNNYNMKLGGVGGFTKEVAKLGYIAAAFSKEMLSENGKKNVKQFTKSRLSENGRKGGLANAGKPRKPKTPEQKLKLSEASKKAWEKRKQSFGG